MVFLAGSVLNLAYTLLLCRHEVSFSNLHAPAGENAGNVWRHSDVPSYVTPARSFLDEGAFLRQGSPDVHRTIGYPLFVALCMHAGGGHWNVLLWICQAFLFALIYAALLFICTRLFPETDRFKWWLLVLYAITGAGIAYSPVLLTDQMANVTLWVAFAAGIAALSASSRSALLWTLHILALLYSANVRPTVILFPLAFWLIAYGMRTRLQVVFPSPRTVMLILLVQFASVQTPAFRNYLNHGIWMPTDIMAINLADYLAKSVLREEGEIANYEAARKGWDNRSLAEKQRARKTFAFSVYRKYPVRTLRVLLVNTCINTLESHWMMTRNLFRQELRSDLRGWGAAPWGWRVFHGAWAVLHALFFLLAFGRLVAAVMRREWLLLGFVLCFSAPYIFSSTDAQGARFRLYMEGLILMLSLSFLARIRFSPQKAKFCRTQIEPAS